MYAKTTTFGVALSLLLSCVGGARAERFDQIVGAVSPEGDAYLVKHFRVSSGAVIKGVSFYSNDLRTRFPRVALLGGPAAKISEGTVVAELGNVSSAGVHRVVASCQPIAIESTADLYVVIQLPVSDGVRDVGDGAGIGARRLRGPTNSYFVSGPDGFFGAMDVDYAIELLYDSAQKAEVPETDVEEIEIFLKTTSSEIASSVLLFGVEHMSEVTLMVYDVAGRRVRTLAKGTFASGVYASQWDGLDESGRRSAAGIYFAKLRVGDKVLTKKLLVVK